MFSRVNCVNSTLLYDWTVVAWPTRRAEMQALSEILRTILINVSQLPERRLKETLQHVCNRCTSTLTIKHHVVDVCRIATYHQRSTSAQSLYHVGWGPWSYMPSVAMSHDLRHSTHGLNPGSATTVTAKRRRTAPACLMSNTAQSVADCRCLD